MLTWKKVRNGKYYTTCNMFEIVRYTSRGFCMPWDNEDFWWVLYSTDRTFWLNGLSTRRRASSKFRMVEEFYTKREAQEYAKKCITFEAECHTDLYQWKLRQLKREAQLTYFTNLNDYNKITKRL